MQYIINISLVLSLFSHSVYAQKTINWLQLGPPWYISSGVDQGNGIVDQTLALLQQEMLDYEHKPAPMTVARWKKNTIAGKHLCIGLVYKTKKRQEHSIFSIPSNILLSPRLIIRSDNKASFGGKDRVSYDKLLNNKKLIGSFESGRSERALDAIVDKYKGNENILISSAGPNQFFQMLMKNRIDYMTDFPFVASYLAKEFSNMDEYTTLSIDEVSPYGTVHMSCPKTVWGKAVITDINLALEKLRGTQAYKNIFEKRLDPSSLVLYKQYYNQQLLNK